MPPATGGVPAPPRRADLDPESPAARLRNGVSDALRALPSFFESSTNIEGVLATDLFALNTLLGATIEVQVVATLNRMREVWDPDNEWQTHVFERRAQTFPDVRLVSSADKAPLLGVELKGWYVLAKEGEPSLRMTVNPRACAELDLIAVVPWHLSNVLAGVPVALSPWVESARYAAEHRNHWWQNVRSTSSDTAITAPSTEVAPYPSKADAVADVPVVDRGRNFGRLARTGIMHSFLQSTRRTEIAGIAAEHWIKFFRIHSESRDHAAISKRLDSELRGRLKAATADDLRRIRGLVDELTAMLGGVQR